MIIMENLAPAPHELDDLSLGIKPFTRGVHNGSNTGRLIQGHTLGFDLMMAGLTVTTLSTQYTFSTNKVQILKTSYEAGLMLKATSIVLDITQGTNVPLSIAFRCFCLCRWSKIEAVLVLSVGELAPSIISGILRWIYIQFGRYI